MPNPFDTDPVPVAPIPRAFTPPTEPAMSPSRHQGLTPDGQPIYQDPEIQVMATVLYALQELDSEDARIRVLRWVDSRLKESY